VPFELLHTGLLTVYVPVHVSGHVLGPVTVMFDVAQPLLEVIVNTVTDVGTVIVLPVMVAPCTDKDNTPFVV
jgi:hypothetical protein